MDGQFGIRHFIPVPVHRGDAYYGNVRAVCPQLLLVRAQQQSHRRPRRYNAVFTHRLPRLICRHPQHAFLIGHLPGEFVQPLLLLPSNRTPVQEQFRVIAVRERPDADRRCVGNLVI